MQFDFYSTDKEAMRASNSKHFSIYVDPENTHNVSCYGGPICKKCPLNALESCENTLALLFKPDTSITITKESHPELFI